MILDEARLPGDRRGRARPGSTSTIRPSTRRPAWSSSRSTRRSSTGSLHGLDDIGVTLQNVDAIDAFEAAGGADRGPVTTALMSGADEPVDWDAATYDRVADAAGGVGARGPRAARAPRRRDRARRGLRQRPGHPADLRAAAEGRVIGVDASPSMIEVARRDTSPTRRPRRAAASPICSSSSSTEPVDAVFSNATFHWILDHERLFERLFARPAAGRRARGAVRGPGQHRGVDARDRGGRGRRALLGLPARHARRPRTSLRSATPRTASRAPASRSSGSGSRTRPSSRPSRGRSRSAVGLAKHLDRLPSDLRDEFVDAVLGSMPRPLVLEYVRLNISARRPD